MIQKKKLNDVIVILFFINNLLFIKKPSRINISCQFFVFFLSIIEKDIIKLGKLYFDL